jgi:LCP family protein required for cell wall assembly
MRIHQQRRRRAAKRWAIGISVALLVMIAVGAAWGYFWLRSVNSTMSKVALADSGLGDALTKRSTKPEEPFTILLTGTDRRPGETVARADTIIIAKVDPKQKKIWMLSIPRDTRVNIPGHGYGKINAAMFYGGADGGNALLVKTVTEFTGIPINYYMDVSFTGFKKAIDTLGGIWIDVDVEIDDWKAASGTPDHRSKYIAPGYQLLDGEHALTYVRSRDFPDADFTRMKHQQTFFKALAKQMTKPESFFKIPSLVNSVSKYVTTTMPIGDIVATAQALQGIEGDNIQTATVIGEWRSPYVWTDEERKAELVKALTEGGSFDGTATPAAEIVPSSVTVTIRNGAGEEGVASAASSILTAAGFKIGEVGNANQFVYDKTLVVYKDDTMKAAAQLVASKLPTGSAIASRGMYEFTTDVLVVVGKDWKAATAATTTR